MVPLCVHGHICRLVSKHKKMSSAYQQHNELHSSLKFTLKLVQKYIGKTKRHSATRIKEHRSENIYSVYSNNPVVMHC